MDRKRYLECGKIVSTHGVRGELRVQPWSDTPDFLCAFSRFYLGEGASALEVESVRVQKNMVLLKLRDVDTLDQAVTMRGKILYIDREDAPPDEDGVFFVQDLLGLAVRDADSGQVYGALSHVFVTGANDVYEITAPDGRKLLIPAIKDVVLSTDLDAGVMDIRPLEGLFDAN